MLNIKNFSLLAIILGSIAQSALAIGANFGQFSMAGGSNGNSITVTGHTGGSYSLSSIANRDSRNKPCFGYGDPNPDHIMVLENDFSHLKIQVDSQGKDTTLIIRGPNGGKILCGDDSGDNKDARIEANNWKAGTYEIWVGSMEPARGWNYRLSANP